MLKPKLVPKICKNKILGIGLFTYRSNGMVKLGTAQLQLQKLNLYKHKYKLPIKNPALLPSAKNVSCC